MKRLLIVSPHFPPVNAPDYHRVRMSLPFYREFGWEPHVLAVRAEDQDEPRDETLLETIPSDIEITRVRALRPSALRSIGIGNVALRAWRQLQKAGDRIIRRERTDLVFFSTTMFFSMPIGRIWSGRHGVPYVLDLQDPWFTTYYDDKPAADRPPKQRLANALHRRLERWTMRRAAGVMTVSAAYADALVRRYPWMTRETFDTIPFGAASRDFEIARRQRAPAEPPAAAGRTAVYVGRGGPDMATAARILFRGLTDGAGRVRIAPDVSLRFIGTDYAADGAGRKSIDPVAAEEGLGARVTETTARQPYLDALRALMDATFLVLIGSDDPGYSASKVYPYLLAGKPILAVVHRDSALVDVLERTGAAVVVTFAGRDDVDEPAARLRGVWPELLARIDRDPATNWEAVQAFTAPHLTRRQCRMFDRAVARR
jgi:glycosyltransferase involved in cell wall biosynthesis